MIRLKIRLLAVALLICACFVSGAAFAQDSVVAKVGSVPITIYEVGRQLQRLIPLEGSYHGNVKPAKIAELRQKALDELIDQALLVQYAYGEELAVTSAEINDMIAPIRARFKSDDDFEQALGQEGEKAFRASISRRLLAEKALQLAVADKIHVDESVLKAEFEKNKEKYKRPRQFKASHILIKIDPALTAEEVEQKKQHVQSLYEKAMAGDDFYNLAYYNSEDKTAMVGGDVGYFHLGQLDKDVEAVVLKMKVGSISKPIRTFYGYEIVKLVEDNPEAQLTYDDVREKLIAAESKRQAKKLKTDLFAMLREKYPVERLEKE